MSKAKHGWYYAIPQPMRVTAFFVAQPFNPSYFPDERNVATFDWLATETGQVYLAYAPEINTVFVAVEDSDHAAP
jgi:hypothetical protein